MGTKVLQVSVYVYPSHKLTLYHGSRSILRQRMDNDGEAALDSQVRAHTLARRLQQQYASM